MKKKKLEIMQFPIGTVRPVKRQHHVSEGRHRKGHKKLIMKQRLRLKAEFEKTLKIFKVLGIVTIFLEFPRSSRIFLGFLRIFLVFS